MGQVEIAGGQVESAGRTRPSFFHPIVVFVCLLKAI